MRNPYSPPEAKVSDAGQGPPGSPPPVSARLYTPGQIALATFFRSFLAASWFYAHNLAVVGRPEWKFRALVVGSITTAITMGIAYLLPEKTPNLLLPLACVFIARTHADINFRKIIGTHLAAGGRQGSWWLVVGVGLLFALAIIAAFVAVFVVISWDEIDVTTAAFQEQPCLIFAAEWPLSRAEMVG